MRHLMLILAAAAPLLTVTPAVAEPAEEAASAFDACLAAVIDGAPVGDIKGQDVQIRRGKDAKSCTVEVLGGEGATVRQSLLTTMGKRRERFTASRTRWDPGPMASRETFCNAASVRRNLNVVIDTALPAAKGPRVVATVLETRERDARCDSDQGIQKPAA